MKSLTILGWLAGGALILAGCRGTLAPGERQARQDVRTVTEAWRPRAERPDVSTLTTNSDLGEFLRFAMLHQPQVEAKYYDWLASVESITVTRSLPDPKLTFQAYIVNSLTSLMPGLMQDFPGPGKLAVAGRAAAAGSEGKYFEFEAAELQAAFDVKSAGYELQDLDERLRLERRTLALLAEFTRAARARDEDGQVTLAEVYRAQIEEAQLATDVTNLADSRQPLLARFKAALGLTRDQPDPPAPARLEATPPEWSADDLLATAFARNPRLQAVASGVRQAEAALAQARQARVPDFSAGLQAEVYEPPFYWPQASMSLPVWRDKIAAEIAGAQADRQAAAARLTAEQISLTVDFALQAYDYREIVRNLALLENQLIPKARQALVIARAGYEAGQVNFFDCLDAERAWLKYQLTDVQERTRYEITLADLSLLIAGVPPPGAAVAPARSAPLQPH